MEGPPTTTGGFELGPDSVPEPAPVSVPGPVLVLEFPPPVVVVVVVPPVLPVPSPPPKFATKHFVINGTSVNDSPPLSVGDRLSWYVLSNAPAPQPRYPR